jgi:2-hydroxychromene-2-carboxylate isomerase
MRDDRQMLPLFFFGAMSPYSWFAAERIHQLLPQAQWRGVLAGAIFKANGRVSWGLTERRTEGMADCEARAAARGLGPICWPQPWPTSDLLIARAMAFAERSRPSPPSAEPARAPVSREGGAFGQPPRGPGLGFGPTEMNPRDGLKRFALEAMRLAFREGADLADPDAVLEVGRRTGIDPDELREAVQAGEVKDALRGKTDQALALGVFGVPTIALGRELFWGDDRLEDAAAAYRSRGTA